MAHRKATSVLEAQGAFRKDPQRRRPPEPKNINPLGPPHESLGPVEAQVWQELAETCPPGVLSQAERLLVEMLARLIAKVRLAGPDMKTADIARIDSMLGKLGMSPADRNRVGVEAPKRESDFDGF